MKDSRYRPRVLATKNAEAGRYELHRHIDTDDRELLSFATYTIIGSVATIGHVETILPHRGNNFAAMLMSGLLDDARSANHQVTPVCSYAVTYMQQHPDTQDLLSS